MTPIAHRRGGGAGGRGLTLVELCIGIMVTGFVATVLAGFVAAMSQQWRHAEQQQYLDVTAQQGRRILSPLVQSARAVGHVYETPAAAVFIWQNDSLDRSGIPQLGEMLLVEYDEATESIYIYQPDSDLNLLGSSMARKAVTASQMRSYSVVQAFKSQAWLKPTRVLLGPGRAVDAETTQLTRVTSCTFEQLAAGGTGDLPVVEINATLQRGDQSLSVVDRFAVRVPTTVVTWTTNTVTGN